MHPLTLSSPATTVTLSGPHLPETELPLDQALSYKKHYYPGNPEPTFQILNTTAEKITVKGLLSDRETGVPGNAQATVDALRTLHVAAEPVTMLYRNTMLEGFIVRLRIAERNPLEFRYEIDIEPAAIEPGRPQTPQPAHPSTAALAASLQAYRDSLAGLPTIITDGPANSAVSLAMLLDPTRIPPAEYDLDRWLDFRIASNQSLAVLDSIVGSNRNTGILTVADTTRDQLAGLNSSLLAGRDQILGAPLGGTSIASALGQAAQFAAVVSALDALRLDTLSLAGGTLNPFI